jgi:hypothetical protein
MIDFKIAVSADNHIRNSARSARIPGQNRVRRPFARIYGLRGLLRPRPGEGSGYNDEGQKEVRSDGRLGPQAWAGGDPKKPLVTDATKQCFECHQARKEKDYVYSTYIP